MIAMKYQVPLQNRCLLICTLTYENQGFKKSMFLSNLRKISGPANLDFLRFSPKKNLCLYYKPEKIQVCSAWLFSKVWSRPWLFKTLISQDFDFQKSRCRLKGHHISFLWKAQPCVMQVSQNHVLDLSLLVTLVSRLLELQKNQLPSTTTMV